MWQVFCGLLVLEFLEFPEYAKIEGFRLLNFFALGATLLYIRTFMYLCSTMKKYVDVILPLPLNGTIYVMPFPMTCLCLLRRAAGWWFPFGRKKYYTAIISNVHYCPPSEYEVKELFAVLYDSPVLLPLLNIGSGNGFRVIICCPLVMSIRQPCLSG
jgi:primosomal protein N' (replication factor Y)